MPTWVKGAIGASTSAADLTEGPVLRRVNRGDEVQDAAMSEKVVWQLLQQYAAAAGVPGIAPHDLRRSCAKLCRAAGGELE
jgi:integrase